ncbi:MAG TPA: amino acid adenylation domain-containing protein, partial [Fluviicola sp.]|nr:amino acid adenylation domain-containing protein [Fluviicola sp.]
IRQLIGEVHEVITQAKIHQELPFEKLVDMLGVERDTSRHPLYQVMFSVQNFGNASQENTDELPFWPVSLEENKALYTSAKFDMSLFLMDSTDKIGGLFNYAVCLFEEETIARISAVYVRILEAFAADVETSVGDIGVLSNEEKQLQLIDWNRTDAPYPSATTLQQLFEEQVAAAPEQVALVYEGQALTYAELNDRSNRLARKIRKQYIKRCGQELQPDTLVALYLDRGVDMIVSMLAVLKAGGAYIPVSPDYPEERFSHILNDTAASIIVSEDQYLERLALWSAALVQQPDFMTATDQQLFETEQGNLQQYATAENLAYIIYTSGTTGKPKGVMIEHRAVVNTVSALNTVYDISNEYRRVACFSEYVFDVSVSEIFNTLCYGGELHLLSKEVKTDATLLTNYVREQQINYLFVAPAMLSVMKQESYPSLRAIIIAGEACDQTAGASWAAEYSLYNYYGPTEGTIYSTGKRVDVRNVNEIGKPIRNARAYVLNDALQPLPVGSSGELYIGGAGLSRGYLNLPELTAERFIDNPFATEEDKAKGYTRLYKTGDLVRWLPDGNLAYLGRKDTQIKLRGYRIELGEIESAITQMEGVDQAAVIDFDRNGTKYLAAYVVAPGMEITYEVLHAGLSKQLPSYMIPSVVVQLDALPLTINGKLDRRALPVPEFSAENAYVAPSTPLEKDLCSIWEQVLDVEKVGVNDNFFRRGGNSITAVKLTAISRQKLGIDIPLSLLFAYPTVAGTAANLAAAETVIIPKADVARYPLSFSQERLLFIERFEKGSAAYHMPYFVKLGREANINDVVDAIQVVVDRHPVLKTVYRSDENGDSYQVILDRKVAFSVHETDREALAAVLAKTIARPFDLEHEPGIKLHHYLAEGEQYLLILWHHIAFDGWSATIFMQELAQAYDAATRGTELHLPDNGISFVDYAHWQRDYLNHERLELLGNYWTNHLAGFETLNLPTDYPRPGQPDYSGKNLSFELDNGLAAKLRNLAMEEETTLFTVLLGGFYIALAALSGQKDIVIGTPSDNRHHPQVQPLIGFFVNSLALRAQVDPQASICEFIRTVHQVVSQGKVHQDLPFEQLVDRLNLERDPSRHPVYQVMFDVQYSGNATGTELTLPFEMATLGSGTYTPAKFDLDVSLIDSGTALGGIINYADSLFEEQTIERISAVYNRVLQALVENNVATIGQIELVPEADRVTLLETWNDTAMDFASATTIHGQFEEQVRKTPGNTALIYGEEKWTYSELNEQAERFAFAIRRAAAARFGDAPVTEPFVALYLDKSAASVISILGVLKAGYAYVPLSSENPADRNRFILEDTQAFLIISQEHYLQDIALIKPADTAIVTVEKLVETVAQEMNEAPVVSSGDLAYVIYTSGTTGVPKGVLIEHRSVTNLVANQRHKLHLSDNECVIWLASYVFDASVEQLFLALLSGSRLVIPQDNQVKDTDQIKALIVREGVTHLDATPGYLLAMGEIPAPNQLIRVVSGGEKFSTGLQALWGSKLINEYGPTETTVTSVQKIDYSETSPVNCIGVPVANTKAYVVTETGKLAAIGTPGELCISGAALARGYLNRPDLTAERFPDNPFATAEERTGGYAKLYKTGDLVRWLPNGQLEFLGRVDTQVKIRGYRVELSEIESVLTNHESIAQSAVTVFERNGEHYIAAYIVGRESQTTDVKELRSYLSGLLPSYMIPATIVPVDAIPLTINGKVNERALPQPELIGENIYVAPRNGTEEKIAGVWSEVLAVKDVSIHDNFFRIGGNSLNAAKVIFKINQALSADLSIADLFRHPTVSALAGHFLHRSPDQVLIKELGPVSATKPTIFMVHPGRTGLEVYHQLAGELKGEFNCVGIDNYNLISTEKIDVLPDLAKLYVNELRRHYSLDKPVILLGWSLGGQLAIEMAWLLETEGVQDIQLYLIDTVLNFNAPSPEEKQGLEQMAVLYRDEMTKQGFSSAYIESALEGFAAEDRLAANPLSGVLEQTHVTHFRAGKQLTGVNGNEVSVVHEPDPVAGYAREVTTILLEEKHHWNILGETAFIKNEIVSGRLTVSEELNMNDK